MIDCYFKYRGRDSRDMAIEAEDFFDVSEAVPNAEQFAVPGRNGNLTYWDGTYANRTITAPSFLASESIAQDIARVNEWLLSAQTYDKLILSNDAEHFFLARATQGVSENVRADLVTPFYIEFDALPQKYLISGEREYAAGEKIYNPTKFTAFPIWKIQVTDTVQMTVGGKTLTISGTSGTVIIDTEAGTAINSNGENVNSKVSFGEDLVLLPGVNEVSISGGTLRYIPRWWTL